MVFSLFSRLVNGIKEGVKAGLKGVTDIGSAIVGVVRNVTVTTLEETGEFLTKGVEATASIVKGAISGVADVVASVLEQSEVL